MTINQAVEDFLSWKSTHMDNGGTYKTALKPLTDFYGSWETEDVTITTITTIVSRRKGNTFMFLTVLKIFSRYCHWAKINCINPHLIKVRRKYDPVEQPYLLEDEVETMCSILPDDTFLGIRNQLIIRMLFQTGMRLSELLELTVSSIDAQENSLKIITKKSKLHRHVGWSMDTHRLLQTYLGMRVSKDWRTERLFINKHGAILTSRGVEYMFDKISEEALGEKKHPHMARHGKAIDVFKKGGTIYHVKTILGHSNLESALTYLRLGAKDSLELVKRFI